MHPPNMTLPTSCADHFPDSCPGDCPKRGSRHTQAELDRIDQLPELAPLPFSLHRESSRATGAIARVLPFERKDRR